MTSKLYALCPKCTSNIPSFIIDKNNHTKLKIKCKCGYNNSLSLYEYLDNYNKTKIEHHYTFTCLKHNLPFVSYSPLHSQHYCKDCNADQSELFMIMINDIQIDTIKENLQQAENFINSSNFSQFKAQAIERLQKQISDINFVYEDCVKRNKAVISFLNIIVSNYQSCYNFYDLLQNNKTFNLSVSNKDAVMYYKYYSLLSNTENFHCNRISFDKALNVLKRERNSFEIKLLNDQRLAISLGYSISIYDNKKFNCELTIKADYNILTFCQLENGHLVLSLLNNQNQIWSISEQKLLFSFRNNNIIPNSIVSLQDNLFAFHSVSLQIMIWKDSPPYSEKPFKEIDVTFYTNRISIYSQFFYFVKEKKILIRINAKNLECFDMKTYQMITVINIKSSDNMIIKKIDDKRIGALDEYKMLVINIEKWTIEEEIEIESLSTNFAMWNCDCIIFVGYMITLYNRTTKEEVSFLTKNYIRDIFEINDNSILLKSEHGLFLLEK